MAITAQALEDYRKLAQAGNKRLQRAEKLSQQPGYKGIMHWSYDTAMTDIKALRGEGHRRFPSAPKSIPTNPREAAALEIKIRRATKAIQAFMESPSSTKSGIDKTYRKQAKSFSEGAKADFTVAEMSAVFESGLWDALITAGYGSETTRRIVGQIKRNAADLQKLRDRHQAMRLSSDKSPYADRINAWLSSNDTAARVLGQYLSAINA